MKSKTTLNEEAKGHEFSLEETKHLKNILFSILTDVDFVSGKYSVPFYSAWGTLPGAVRRKGFIPWDDNVDIIVPVDRMKELQKDLETEFPKKYFFSGVFSDNSTGPFYQLLENGLL